MIEIIWESDKIKFQGAFDLSVLIRDIYKKIMNHHEVFNQHIFAGLDSDQMTIFQDAGYSMYEGKVRQCFTRKNSFIVVHTDRLSAFDRMIGYVPYKGAILSAISEFWFEKIKGSVPSHFVSGRGDRIIETRWAEPIKAEVIVRGYLAGSMLRAYESGQREFCGIRLPENLKPYSRLPFPIITPTTKAEAFEHDENTTRDLIISKGIANQHEWQQIEEMALKLFSIGSEVFLEQGWILVDTKYEFGRLDGGQIILIDEAHTPDSSRLWKSDTYAERIRKGLPPSMLDKEIIREYLLSEGFSGTGDVPKVADEKFIELGLVYLNVVEKLIQKPLAVDVPFSLSHLEI